MRGYDVRVKMKAYQTVISADELMPKLNDPDWAVIDCRFSLDDPKEGRRAYLQAHIPGALYAHLDHDLSGEIIPGETGRHPLPEVDDFAKTLSNWGIDERVQVVSYDDRSGAIAARLWWMLNWMGHEKAAVLDGGWSYWRESGYPLDVKIETRPRREFIPRPRPEMAVDVDFVERVLTGVDFILLDARDGERYQGREEPIDPIAGHIPGAGSAPYVHNLTDAGTFRSKDELRERFERLLGDRPAQQAVFYCGSGVTSAHNILAMAHAGFALPRLYPGSWSEWITDPSRPIE